MGWLPTLRLESDGLDSLDLDYSLGWIVQKLDIGFPVVRPVVQNAPDADGTIDTTLYFGPRNVTLEVVLEQTMSGVSLLQMEHRLRAFMSPRRRVRMVGVFEEGGAEVQLWLRGSNLQSIVGALAFRSVVLQWVCPSGLLESAELHSVTANAGGYSTQSGRTYNLTFNRVYPAAGPSSGGALCVNAGNVPVWPTIFMYGPFSAGTLLRNDTADQELAFVSTMSITTGDWLKIDFAAKTIVNSTGMSYYDSLDFPNSQWWHLQPGDNRIYMVPTTFTSPPAAMQVDWRDGWL